MNGLFNLYPYTLLPLTCGIILIVTGYIKLWKLRKTNYPESIGIFWTWLLGVIGLLLGIFGQVLSMVEAFDSISQAGTISPSMVADGIKNSYKPTLFGLTVLIISLVVWGILNGIKQRKIYLKPTDPS
ncbi:MotA/TolQ/ExbB proton channel family protein [Carboxylicivirga marina]|uniref:MotA/TolQ/ExbB proton channel family protein n=1 Tax=Carboxylicivirga marina TaxID=2800988 RepID=A0ABS1HI32_9BACT|nr:MotA/TolQ/ExbB proton channel family protein [Carboxylicivirga marina]MBK3517295.1 MotA/TolQ/ExbB proton channel family protein [Carboxylicivirga marina]